MAEETSISKQSLAKKKFRAERKSQGLREVTVWVPKQHADHFLLLAQLMAQALEKDTGLIPVCLAVPAAGIGELLAQAHARALGVAAPAAPAAPAPPPAAPPATEYTAHKTPKDITGLPGIAKGRNMNRPL